MRKISPQYARWTIHPSQQIKKLPKSHQSVAFFTIYEIIFYVYFLLVNIPILNKDLSLRILYEWIICDKESTINAQVLPASCVPPIVLPIQ